jgi:hypothetical protein
MLRQLPELLPDDPAWPLVQTWLEEARNSVEEQRARRSVPIDEIFGMYLGTDE